MKLNATLLVFILLLSLGCKVKHSIPHEDEENGAVDIHRTNFGAVNSNIIAHIQEYKTGEPIVLAKMIVLKDEQLFNGALADPNGNVEIRNIPLGNYRVRIEAIGYNTMELYLKNSKSENIHMQVKMGQRIERTEKPVIYLYPTVRQQVHVQLDYDGMLTHTYPAYPAKGWIVTADPNGTLWDEDGQEYYALFWEGIPKRQFAPTDGFVVPRKQTARFLEEKLAYLGLSRREANEFIMYWLPRLEDNPYNFIHFAGSEYEELAGLNITPVPETIIRVMMLTQPLERPLEVPVQDLTSLKKSRKGFTVVEWGGGVVDCINAGS